MGWMDHYRKTWREMAKSAPGERFVHIQELREARRKESPTRSILVLILGVVLIFSGLVLWLTPVLPGFFLSIVGLAIIAARLPWLARFLDRFELWLRRMWRRVRGRK